MNAMHHSILCEFMNTIGFMVFGNHLIPLDPNELLPFGDPNGNARFTGYYNDTISVFRATRDIAMGEEIRMCPLRLNPAAFPFLSAAGSAASGGAVDEERHVQVDGCEDGEDGDDEGSSKSDQDEEGQGTLEIPKPNKGKGKAVDMELDNGEGPSNSREEWQVRAEGQGEAPNLYSGSRNSPLSFRAALALPAPGFAGSRPRDPLTMTPAIPSTGNQQQKKVAKSDSGGDAEHVEDVANKDGANDTAQNKKLGRTARFKLVLRKKFGIKDKREAEHNKDNQAEGEQIEDSQSGVKHTGDSEPATSEHQELAD
ncbi:hypothetical protein HER10_EVM0002124 [Colletotrichum scovillei]|uniref:uncharacterized protein n=1 Tax=Colletotrichum scovillei TaxID=1209932 RepID=UPI0015C2DE7C|nr:uncharacterized protein HER10_EVM0002124 [Colletotrichum scovillei]KAF4777470.1 hypothetical protein HER10_EVM0002124 [Colletotrichum scovillei]